MTDYYPLIARGIAGLGDSNAESRRALYQQVRAALLGHLRAINPPLEEPEILRECLSFDDAVRRVEAETAGREAESLGEVLSRIEAPNLLPGREDLNLTDVRLRRPPRRKGVAIAAKRLTKVLASIAAWYAVFAVIALAFALYWQRDRVKAWFVASPAAQWQHEIASLLPKITDRAAPQSSSAASAQSASLYEEDPAEKQGKRYAGSVIWKTETVSPEGKPPEPIVRAKLEVPERRIHMTMLLRRNTDESLSASHTIEIEFHLPADFSFGGIANVPAILMKGAENTAGAQLAAVTAKVTSGSFLIGLSAADVDMRRNLEMLKERPWFGIPIVYNNGRRAMLAIAKGSPGERAFQEAFAAWPER